ncbi:MULTISPECIES: DUF547 domain-containing protein [unclassified Leptolyngbya]|uniref:DUF547 domain-containing protein n=1 Tax=unclassified Leptolyngbya TaxID=2650499 RepID=UPI001687E596|nr:MULTISPECIES: DUF547 domain-containing protein [unclassified Leptolyngbya]MBD1913515.1 DUF547 domain-containing protein [Leptolyngbya sp. FACHB-8]MBD2153263.1 DUF547 domain-containing protein [Leptolyngbya sp. FACHB-16]
MVNFALLDALLKAYVDGEGRVNYGRWQREAQTDLRQWLASVQPISLSDLSADTQLALLINLYNALVIEQVLMRYPTNSILPKFLGVPNWLAFLRFFERSRFSLNNQSLSLNKIEHGILRQHFTEPRIHFALVCAAVGCPLLRSGAYWADRVQEQLEEDAQRFIHNPAKVRYDADSRTLYCSKILKWYGKDFLKVAPSIPAYIQRYLSGVEIPETATVRYLPYDWSLNQRTSS